MKKRKKLHGDTAQKAREILEAFCLEKLELSLDMIAETSDDKSYLCHKCDGELARLSRLQGELKCVSSSIMSKLQSLRVLSADTGSNTAGCDIADTCGSAASTSKATTSSRKRHASDSLCDNDGEEKSPGVKVQLYFFKQFFQIFYTGSY